MCAHLPRLTGRMDAHSRLAVLTTLSGDESGSDNPSTAHTEDDPPPEFVASRILLEPLHEEEEDLEQDDMEGLLSQDDPLFGNFALSASMRLR